MITPKRGKGVYFSRELLLEDSKCEEIFVTEQPRGILRG
jgi:hypothetical protein